MSDRSGVTDMTSGAADFSAHSDAGSEVGDILYTEEEDMLVSLLPVHKSIISLRIVSYVLMS
jgi:hypothetical protein